MLGPSLFVSPQRLRVAGLRLRVEGEGFWGLGLLHNFGSANMVCSVQGLARGWNKCVEGVVGVVDRGLTLPNSLCLCLWCLWCVSVHLSLPPFPSPPVLDPGRDNVTGFFPAGKWYDLDTGAPLHPLLPPTPLLAHLPKPRNGNGGGGEGFRVGVGWWGGGVRAMVSAPLGSCPVFVRGGYALPVQRAALTTRGGRGTPFKLLFAADERGLSQGDAVLDDGEVCELNPRD
jgi:hypothetical protein